jgi:hypothetical protein
MCFQQGFEVACIVVDKAMEGCAARQETQAFGHTSVYVFVGEHAAENFTECRHHGEVGLKTRVENKGARAGKNRSIHFYRAFQFFVQRKAAPQQTRSAAGCARTLQRLGSAANEGRMPGEIE